MKSLSVSLLSAILVAFPTDVAAIPSPEVNERDVYTNYPYTGPEVPVGDWVDPTINGNGKGFPRLVEPPAVKPKSKKPKNNINVIQTSYIPNGINIQFQTPFGLGEAPSVLWGRSAHYLSSHASGTTST